MPCGVATCKKVVKHGPDGKKPFHLAFKKGGGKWTKKFCQMDSDGDGLSNGAELGDPDCKWKVGDPPTKLVSNPWIKNDVKKSGSGAKKTEPKKTEVKQVGNKPTVVPSIGGVKPSTKSTDKTTVTGGNNPGPYPEKPVC